MTAPTPIPDDLPADIEQTITEAEKASVAQFEDERRYNLLRVIVPAILILSGIAFPFGIFNDVTSSLSSHSLSLASSAENGIVFFGCLLSFWALRQRRITLSALSLFVGVSGVLFLLISYDTFFPGPLTVGTLPEFALLLMPIVLAGVIGGPRLTLAMMGITPLFTFLVLTFAPRGDATTVATLALPGSLSIYIDSIALQVGMGVLILVTTNSIRRTQRDLNTTRIAYRRERELDRLKNQFISNVNHELRTPLMSMRGYLVLARELGKRDDPEQQDYMLSRGIETVGHMEGIVESILDVRRLETTTATLDLVPVHLRDAIMTAIRLLGNSMTGDRARDLHLRVDDALWALADQETLVQVVLNLLSNACKYSEAGTSIEVMARLLAAPGASSTRAAPALSVEVAIRDHGLGIPPEQIPLLFQRFVRLERDVASPTPGTGLGLAICRTYIEAMGGKIWVESTGIPGDGSTFFFTLPQAAAIPVPHPAAATADMR